MNSFNVGEITYDHVNNIFTPNVSFDILGKYLRMVYSNRDRFHNRFMKPLKKFLKAVGYEDNIPSVEILDFYFENATPFTYSEAFQISDNSLKSIVFSAIDINELMENLGHERILTEGKNVTHKKFRIDGTYEMINYDVIYELHKVDCSKIMSSNFRTDEPYAYAVKCWCTSTNKEHWLWVEEEYAKKGPLEAIASTVRVYENMIPHIKEIKRQGDVFLFEMDKEIIPSGEIVPLDAETYFRLLVAQT
jgi:hypothetical protein